MPRSCITTRFDKITAKTHNYDSHKLTKAQRMESQEVKCSTLYGFI